MNPIQIETTPSLAGIQLMDASNLSRSFEKHAQSAARLCALDRPAVCIHGLRASLNGVTTESAAWGCSAVRGAFLPPLMWEM